MKRHVLGAAAAAAVCCVMGGGVSHAAVNIVSNPGFELGQTEPDGWDEWGWEETEFGSPFFGSPTAHSGSWQVKTGCVGDEAVSYCRVSQTLTTTAGALYDLSFWTANGDGTTGQIAVYWDGVEIANFETADGWTQFSFSNLVATSTSTVLSIGGRNDPDNAYLDDVSVTAAVPEPAAWALMLTGFFGAGAAVRSRRRAVADAR